MTHRRRPIPPSLWSALRGGLLTVLVGTLSPAAVGADDDPAVRAGRDWWAFRPVVRPRVPEGGRAGPETPIDAFVRAGQEAAGVSASAEADRETLIRRLSFDLRGLPPSPAEVDAFLGDGRPDAYERLVDAYLASAAFGQRWATPWLDLARHADSAGFEDDARRPDAWRYRDWVVDALNADMPYDRFVGLQLAADEIAPDEPRQKAALGFLRAGPTVGNERTERVRMDELDDVVRTTSAAFLGLTVGCARCHDHKADPIPTEDYYRLAAVFAPARPADLPLATDAEVARHREATRPVDEAIDAARVERIEVERPARDRLVAARRASLPGPLKAAYDAGNLRSLSKADREEIARRMEVSDADLAGGLTDRERAAVAACRDRIARLEASRPAPTAEAMGVVESPGRVRPVRVLIRGEVGREGDAVAPGPPRAVAGRVIDFADGPPGAPTTGRRAALARWIVGPAGPLAARVEVNRIWQGHFGAGLVRTPSDLGATGEPPALPGLLDWLASELVRSGWSRKAIHRQIVLSAAYRRSSRVDDPGRRADPEGIHLGRFPLRRLDAESIRDAILACAGTLDERAGGPGVFPPIDPGAVRGGNVPRWPLDAVDGPGVWRRSLYVFRMRSVPLPLLEAFDRPDAAQSCPSRSTTTVPTQALALLNSPFVVDQSRRFADRVAREAGPDPSARVVLAFRLATGRRPSEAQRRAIREYLGGPGDLAGACQALFNSNAFLYLD